MQLSENTANTICETLADDGYLVVDHFLPEQLTDQLYHYVRLIDQEEFATAAIGRAQDKQHDSTIRNDKTRWLSNSHDVEQHYLDIMDQLRLFLNRQLFLGLRDFEAHFAHFEAGHYYQRHLDAFRGRSNRVVSTVFYLNSDWSADDGGELIIYPTDDKSALCSVTPKFGTLVIFMSEQFPHEVMPAKRDRYSIAGWFRSDNPVL